MRKVTSQACQYFWRTFFTGTKNCCSRNTKVTKESNQSAMLYLHGNRIAWLDTTSGVLSLSLCGWDTLTTRERLNGLLTDSPLHKNWGFYSKGGCRYFGYYDTEQSKYVGAKITNDAAIFDINIHTERSQWLDVALSAIAATKKSKKKMKINNKPLTFKTMLLGANV